MKIYFLSSTPCALRINGVFLGRTDLFERSTQLSLADNAFVEFIPQNAQPICFFLTENIRFSPPPGCAVYLLPNALAVYAKEFEEKDCSLKIIVQERFVDNLITVYQQGRIHISLETEKGFFIAYLPPSFSKCSLSFHDDLFLIRSEKQLAIYTKTGKCVFLEDVVEYSIEENTLNTTMPPTNCIGKQKTCSYSLTPDGCYQTRSAVRQSPNAAQMDIWDEALFAYAFFENLLLDGNYQEFLSDELLKQADMLCSYLGDFLAVFPAEEQNTCGLLYQKADNVYEVIYYSVKIENGKINDVNR